MPPQPSTTNLVRRSLRLQQKRASATPPTSASPPTATPPTSASPPTASRRKSALQKAGRGSAGNLDAPATKREVMALHRQMNKLLGKVDALSNRLEADAVSQDQVVNPATATHAANDLWDPLLTPPLVGPSLAALQLWNPYIPAGGAFPMGSNVIEEMDKTL